MVGGCQLEKEKASSTSNFTSTKRGGPHEAHTSKSPMAERIDFGGEKVENKVSISRFDSQARSS
jgi:hypothetical protein